ncbi:MAG: acyltransferase [Thermodesulfobacteriota bacterium]|nr:acyltransferase [Thermodesulfobacteriota bacterium]
MNIYIHPTAEVSEEAEIGKGTKIWHGSQIRERAFIGENCIIGKGVYVDDGVVIGNGVKISNHVSVYKGVTIENDVLLGPNCTFTNDSHPRAFNKDWQITNTLIKEGASIGANATVLCGVTVGKFSMIGVGSVVIHDTLPHSLMVGNPSVRTGFVCVCGFKLKVVMQGNNKAKFKCGQCRKEFTVNFKKEIKCLNT